MEIELADAVAAVRDELVEAAARGVGQAVAFTVGPIEMEFAVELRADARAKAGFKAWVLSGEVGGGVERRGVPSRSSVHVDPETAGRRRSADLRQAGAGARPPGTSPNMWAAELAPIRPGSDKATRSLWWMPGVWWRCNLQGAAATPRGRVRDMLWRRGWCSRRRTPSPRWASGWRCSARRSRRPVRARWGGGAHRGAATMPLWWRSTTRAGARVKAGRCAGAGWSPAVLASRVRRGGFRRWCSERGGRRRPPSRPGRSIPGTGMSVTGT